MGTTGETLRIHAEARVTRRPWGPEEELLLGTMSDAALARRLGRTRAAVAQRRSRVGKVRRPRGRAWTPEEEALLHSLPPEEVARLTGRSPMAIAIRRTRLGIGGRTARKLAAGPHGNGSAANGGAGPAAEANGFRRAAGEAG
jgi:hypothetical protein